MLLHVLRLHGAEGAKPHVQQHRHDLNAHFADLFHQLRREVQPGGGGGGGAVVAGVDGLVAVAVLQLFVDVGRQGHLAQLVQHRLQRALADKLDDAAARVGRLQHARHQLAAAEGHFRAGLEPPPRAHQRLPLLGAELLEQQHLRRAAAGALADEPRGDDARVVDHQHVAGAQVVHDVVKVPVFELPVFAVHHQHAAVVARLHRRLGDQFLGQVVVKIMRFHGLSAAKGPPRCIRYFLPSRWCRAACGCGR